MTMLAIQGLVKLSTDKVKPQKLVPFSKDYSSLHWLGKEEFSKITSLKKN